MASPATDGRSKRGSAWFLTSLGLLLLALWLAIPPLAQTGSITAQYERDLHTAVVISLVNLSALTVILIRRRVTHS